MTTLFRIDPGQFDFSEAARSQRPHPLDHLAAGGESCRAPAKKVRQLSQVTPLDERLQPCGEAFVGEIERRSAQALSLSHSRPVRAPYLAVDLPLDEVRQQRVVLRVTHCESYGLDYIIRGDVMGS